LFAQVGKKMTNDQKRDPRTKSRPTRCTLHREKKTEYTPRALVEDQANSESKKERKLGK